EVVVRNDGDAPLVVDTVTTSCGCTTAVLEPMTLAPGESGTLRIAFDSGAHGPDLRGPLMREVMIASNDPVTPEAVIAVTANILATSNYVRLSGRGERETAPAGDGLAGGRDLLDTAGEFIVCSHHHPSHRPMNDYYGQPTGRLENDHLILDYLLDGGPRIVRLIPTTLG